MVPAGCKSEASTFAQHKEGYAHPSVTRLDEVPVDMITVFVPGPTTCQDMMPGEQWATMVLPNQCPCDLLSYQCWWRQFMNGCICDWDLL